MSASVGRAACLVAALTIAGPAWAQDFAPPAPADAVLAVGAPATALERGLPAADGGLALECALTSWHALPGLVTHAVALGAGWRKVRAAAGVSQTGDAELGWQAAGAALGFAAGRGGAALRGIARRDRAPGERLSNLGAGVGIEAGAGAWLELAGGVSLWASAPQVWRAGVSPPLARPLEIGVACAVGETRAWLSRVAPVTRDPGGGESAGGVALAVGAVETWVEARDGPLRGTLGLAARARALRVAASVESHPVLGETVRVAVGGALGPARSRPAVK